MALLKIMSRAYFLFGICFLACTESSNTASQEAPHSVFDTVEENSRPRPMKILVEEEAYQQKPQTEHKTAPLKADKLALIIAISHYQKDTGWDDISAYNDVPLIKAALAAQGFDTLQQVAVLQDAQATKEGIIEAIESRLIHKAEAGSMIVIHYSGHGQQVEDLNGDELDRFDEAIVPYDAPKRAIGAFQHYKGERHLLDDEIQALLNELREKAGPEGQVLVVLDACHSGTATRGVGKARGTQYKIEFSDNNTNPPSISTMDHGWLQEKEQTDIAPLVVLSGASAGELNYETKDEQGRSVGSLSYAFSRTFAQAGPGHSYQGLFDRIKVDMSAFAPRQYPQLEGDTDLKILGGQLSESYAYYMIKKRFDDKNLSINGGQLLGLTEGTEVALYPIDVQDTSLVPPKAKGKVIHTYLSESDILLQQPLSEREMINSWIFVKNKSFVNRKVQLQLNVQGHTALEKVLKEELGPTSQITWVQENPELLIEMGTTGSAPQVLRILTADGFIIYEHMVDEGNMRLMVSQLRQQLATFAQAKFLRNLHSSDPELAVDFEIIPVTVEQQGGRLVQRSELALHEKMAADHTLELKKGDYIKLKVTNRGKRKAFFTLLDIQPDNQINVLFPNRYRTQEEYFVEAGKTLEPEDIFQIGEPYGLECFKLIATPEPINIQPILQQQRGGSLVSTPPPSAHVETLLFRIIE